MNIVTLKLNHLFHIGTLNIKDRSSYHAEGNGLSVSYTPHEWNKIARGHLKGDLYEISKESPLFALFDSENNKALAEWAIEKGYVTQAISISYSYYDDEMEETYIDLFESFEKAKESVCESEWDTLVEKPYLNTTSKLRKLFGDVRVPTADPYYQLFGLYIEENHPEIDGVWFNFKFDPMRLSAPAGLLFNHKVSEWTFKAIKDSDVARIEELNDFPKELQPIIIF